MKNNFIVPTFNENLEINNLKILNYPINLDNVEFIKLSTEIKNNEIYFCINFVFDYKSDTELCWFFSEEAMRDAVYINILKKCKKV